MKKPKIFIEFLYVSLDSTIFLEENKNIYGNTFIPSKSHWTIGLLIVKGHIIDDVRPVQVWQKSMQVTLTISCLLSLTFITRLKHVYLSNCAARQKKRTMDAWWGNRLHCTAENPLPLPNFYVPPKHILSTTLAQIFRFFWVMPSLGVRSPWQRTLSEGCCCCW